MLNEDYKDMLRCLADERVKYLLMGAYAMGVHGYPRSTIDMDLWVMPSAKNAHGVLRALEKFGSPMQGLSAADFQKDDTIFQIGDAPSRIDLITSATGLEFKNTYKHAIEFDIEGIDVRVPTIADLIKNKKAVGRAKDLADIEALESLDKSDEAS